MIKKMKRTVFLIIALFVMTGAGSAQKTVAIKIGDEKIVAQLIALKREWGKIYVSRDRSALEALLAKEYTVTDDEGVTTDRQTILAEFGATETIYENAAYEADRVIVYGDVAIVAGRGTVKGRTKSGAFHTQYFSTNVFVRRDGRWQAAATHISGPKRL